MHTTAEGSLFLTWSYEFLIFGVLYIRRTLTSPVKLVNCLNSIKENAFCASSYPVIITLEDHLTPDLQAKVAEVIIIE